MDTKNIPKISIARPSQIYPNLDFWFENMPSGNPARKYEWFDQDHFFGQMERFSMFRGSATKNKRKSKGSRETQRRYLDSKMLSRYVIQGCQIVYFHTKNPNFGYILTGLVGNGKFWCTYIMVIWYVLRTFCTYVYFATIHMV
jgi:hypothetical protein